MTITIIIIAAIAYTLACAVLGAYWYQCKYQVTTKTGLKDCDNRPLYEGDLIVFCYEDYSEPDEFIDIIGKIVFENGAFVVKEISFDNYDWNDESRRPELLYTWLKDNPCTKIA